MRLAAQLADADYGWAYVVVGWTLTAVVIAAYFARLVVRIRRGGADAPAGDRTVTTLHHHPAQVPPPPPRRRTGRATSSRPAGALLAVVAVMVLTVVLSENVVYFRTVSEAVKDQKSQGTGRFRLAGAVVPGSIDETGHGVGSRSPTARRP